VGGVGGNTRGLPELQQRQQQQQQLHYPRLHSCAAAAASAAAADVEVSGGDKDEQAKAATKIQGVAREKMAKAAVSIKRAEASAAQVFLPPKEEEEEEAPPPLPSKIDRVAEEKARRKAAAEAQLAALEAQTNVFKSQHRGGRKDGRDREEQVKSAESSHELTEKAVKSMINQTARLEAKVKAMEEEKFRLEKKANEYDEYMMGFSLLRVIEDAVAPLFGASKP